MSNLLKVYEQADEIDHEEGRLAFIRYHDLMQTIADKYRFTLQQTTGAFSALSPNNDYIGNLRSLVSVLHGIREGWTVDDVQVSTYRACLHRAWEFAQDADFLTYTKGPKTRAFYQNIIDPQDATPVVVDGHMLSAYIGERMRMTKAVRVFREYSYDDIAHEVRKLAFRLCIVPCQLQAIIWMTWKRIHNVVYEGNLDMFAVGNQWKVMQDLDGLKPFGRRFANMTVEDNSHEKDKEQHPRLFE